MSMHPQKNYFKEFKTGRVFVETGSYRGDGIQLALDAGFEYIISMDNDKENLAFCRSRFNFGEVVNPNICAKRFEDYGATVTLVLGDSATDLWNVFDGIEDEEITFWLDAHWQMLEGTDPGENPWPLLKELKQIAQHPIKTHTIVIDDFLMLTHPNVTGWNPITIFDALKEINPDYWHKMLANPVIDNLLVAHV